MSAGRPVPGVAPSATRDQSGRAPRTPLAGFALPVALIAIMVIGALVTVGFYASSRDHGRELSAALAAQATHVAELGLEQALHAWSNGSLARVDSVFVELEDEPVRGEQSVARYAIDARRLGSGRYLLSSTARVHAAGRTVVRRVASVVRVAEPALPIPAALAIDGGLTVGGGAIVDGTDVTEGCGPAGDVAGVAARDAALVDASPRGRIDGDPPIAWHPSLDRGALSRFGDVPLDMLVAEATRVYEDGESEAGMGPVVSVDDAGVETCDTSIRGNWGDPSGGTCGDELPVILALGDLHVSGGVGQGILVVEGDLDIGRDFAFYGVVIVKGRLRAAGPGNRVEGAVVIRGDGQSDSGSATLEGSVIRYSGCRVDQAFDAVLRPEPVTPSRTARTPSDGAVGPGNS